MVQVLISLIIFAAAAVAILVLYRMRVNEHSEAAHLNRHAIEDLGDIVKVELADSTKEDEFKVYGDIEYEAVTRNKRRVNRAYRNCVYGIPEDVRITKAAMRNILEKNLPAFEEACKYVDFGALYLLEPMQKWVILVYILRRKLGNGFVIQYLEDKYGVSKIRKVNDGMGTMPRRCFDVELLDFIFSGEVSQSDMTYAVAIDILVNMVYARLRGLGCIEDLRYLSIDGFHYGTSGSVRYAVDGKYDIPYRSTNSVWVQIDAKWVHFSFLDFYTEDEMARVTNLINSWGHAAPMNEKMPYKVNDAADGSRITTVRPPSGECWATFVRMFTLTVRTMKWLIDKPEVHNWELPRQLIYYLMRAEETTAFTGQQNTGKTTMMAAAVDDVDLVNIRVLEMSFELALREIYTDRDIYTVKPTDYVSAAELQDMLKKTDAYLSLVGEVAQDIVAARMIQFCIIASAFTIFSHHAKTDKALVEGLAQSLVACGEYKDHEVALSVVLDAIQNNVHLDFMTVGGNKLRFIDYISEIRKEDTTVPYPEMAELLSKARGASKGRKADFLAQCLIAYADLSREYMTRKTDRVAYTTNKIIEFNKRTMAYEPKGWYSAEAMTRILKKLEDDDRKGFLSFYYRYWRKGEEDPYDGYIPDKLKADLLGGTRGGEG